MRAPSRVRRSTATSRGTTCAGSRRRAAGRGDAGAGELAVDVAAHRRRRPPRCRRPRLRRRRVPQPLGLAHQRLQRRLQPVGEVGGARRGPVRSRPRAPPAARRLRRRAAAPRRGTRRRAAAPPPTDGRDPRADRRERPQADHDLYRAGGDQRARRAARDRGRGRGRSRGSHRATAPGRPPPRPGRRPRRSARRREQPLEQQQRLALRPGTDVLARRAVARRFGQREWCRPRASARQQLVARSRPASRARRAVARSAGRSAGWSWRAAVRPALEARGDLVEVGRKLDEGEPLDVSLEQHDEAARRDGSDTSTAAPPAAKSRSRIELDLIRRSRAASVRTAGSRTKGHARPRGSSRSPAGCRSPPARACA